MLSFQNLTVLCFILVAITSAQSQTQAFLTKLESILDKLEAFALDKSGYSHIDYDDLMNVARAYDSQPVEFKNKARQSPALRLALDLAINPMKMIGLQIDHEPKLWARHLIRLQDAYKRFRPAYLGEQIGNKNFKLKVNRSLKLYKVLSGQDTTTPLTLRLFKDAKAESDVWRAKLDELTVVEDIFASLEELQSILNYFNAPVFKPLFEHVFPNLKANSNVEELKSLYYEKLWSDCGIKFVDGTPTLYRGQGKPSAQSAGFTHVVTA